MCISRFFEFLYFFSLSQLHTDKKQIRLVVTEPPTFVNIFQLIADRRRPREHIFPKKKASGCFSVCSLRGIDDLHGKISEQMFALHLDYNFLLIITFPYPKKEVGWGGGEEKWHSAFGLCL